MSGGIEGSSGVFIQHLHLPFHIYRSRLGSKNRPQVKPTRGALSIGVHPILCWMSLEKDPLCISKQ